MRASGWGDAVLLDLRFRTELADELLHFLLLHPREQLLLDGVEGGELHGADVVALDDVSAELGLNRRLGVFPLFQLRKRFGERLDEGPRGIPVEVAALVLRARILRLLG